MATDSKNTSRLDLTRFYNDIKEYSFHQLRGTQYSTDDYAITDQELPFIHRQLLLPGCAFIANDADLAKHWTQTGIDAISYYDEWEDYEDYVDANDEFTGPDSTTVSSDDIVNREHNEGEKLDKTATPDYITFNVGLSGIDDAQLRFTIVQEFIRNALIAYVMKEWYKIRYIPEFAALWAGKYQEALDRIEHNAISSFKNKTRRLNITELNGI